MDEVLAQFYTNTRDAVGADINEIVLTDGAGVEQVTLDDSDTASDKEWSYNVNHTDSRVEVTAVVSPINADVPTGDYGGSILRDAVDGNDITAEETFTTASLSSDDDELTVNHYVEIPQQA